MPTAYFPNPSIWYVVAVMVILSGFLSVAAWIDWTTWRIPKPLTLSLLATGLVMQLIGGAWMGALDKPGWMYHGGIGLGLLDGLLFSLAGAASGFGIFFVLWILGVAGGGDVKHATALGAWLGPKCLFGVFLLSAPVVIVVVLWMMASSLLSKGKIERTKPAVDGKPGKFRVLSFSLPFALATLAFFLLMFRVPLGLSAQ